MRAMMVGLGLLAAVTAYLSGRLAVSLALVGPGESLNVTFTTAILAFLFALAGVLGLGLPGAAAAVYLLAAGTGFLQGGMLPALWGVVALGLAGLSWYARRRAAA